MKSNILSFFILGAAALVSSCTSDMEYKDVDVTPVDQLYSPKDNKQVELQASATASVFFEWSPSLAQDGNAPLYEVVFDKADGDFTKPIYRMTSDDMGTRSYATITHKVLDKVGQLAGLETGETGTVKWTVVSSRGFNQETAKESHSLVITRLLGFSEIPSQLFITGEGSEGGTDVTKALGCASPASGEFEVFTRLEAGKTYHFVDKAVEGSRVFYVDGSKLKESENGVKEATVKETGIYRINLDFNVATVSMKKVVSLGWFFSPDNKVDIPMNYVGNGAWSGQGQTPFHQESWGRDERYKFEMVLDNNGTKETIHWGPTKASLDSRPSDNQAEDYFYMKQWPVSQWDNKWKLHGRFDSGVNGGKTTKFTFIVNASGPYRHKVEFGN